MRKSVTTNKFFLVFYGVRSALDWFRIGVGLLLDRNWIGVGLALYGHWFGIGFVLELCWICIGVVLDLCWISIGLANLSYTILHHLHYIFSKIKNEIETEISIFSAHFPSYIM